MIEERATAVTLATVAKKPSSALTWKPDMKEGRTSTKELNLSDQVCAGAAAVGAAAIGAATAGAMIYLFGFMGLSPQDLSGLKVGLMKTSKIDKDLYVIG